MSDRARVAPLSPDERDERQAALVREAGAELHVYTTLVRNADVFADLLTLNRRLLQQSTLDPRVRELLIMRVAGRCKAPYVWSHHEVIGRAAGLTDDDLAALAAERAGGEDALLLRAVDELVVDHTLGDATWRGLADRYPIEQVIEMCVLVGHYATVASVVNALGIQLEDG
jgi:alkylhydroperoxidase family enzyme